MVTRSGPVTERVFSSCNAVRTSTTVMSPSRLVWQPSVKTEDIGGSSGQVLVLEFLDDCVFSLLVNGLMHESGEVVALMGFRAGFVEKVSDEIPGAA